MFATLQNPLNLVGRLLLALLFLPAGISKIAGFAGTVGYIGSKGLPLPELGAVIAIVMEVGGSLALIAGFKTRLVALAMAIFTLAATLVFHNFWAVDAAHAMAQQTNFFKNLAIIGGFLILAAQGAGGWSLDARREA